MKEIIGVIVGIIAIIGAVFGVYQYIDKNYVKIQRVDTIKSELDALKSKVTEVDAKRDLIIVEGGNFIKDEKEADWTLSKNSGNRTFHRHIVFKQKFSEKPNVFTALNYMDCSTKKNLRINCYPSNITETGFDISFTVWADTVIHGVGARWIALGR
jgi:hypothetical protein